MVYRWPIFNLFSVFFKRTIQFLQQINVINFHPVYIAGIQTPDLHNMSLLTLPLEHGSRPIDNVRSSLVSVKQE